MKNSIIKKKINNLIERWTKYVDWQLTKAEIESSFKFSRSGSATLFTEEMQI